MKKAINLLSTFTIFLLTTIALLACSAEDGVDGLNGKDGEVGLTGPAGPMGNANVVYSTWKSFQSSQRDTLIDGTKLRVNHLIEPKLTQNIIDTGSIQVFMRFQSTVWPLPITSDAGSATMANTVSYIPSPSKLFITRYTHDNSASIGFGSVQWRYIFIPGNALAKGKDVSKLSYEELCKMYNIPE